MINTVKPTGRASSIPGGLAVGALISILVTMTAAAIIAKLMESGVMKQNQVGYGTMALLLAASFSGAVTAQGRVKHRRFLVCMLSGLVYLLILVSITALFFGGQYTGFAATSLLVLGGAGTAAILSVNREGKPRKRSLPKRK